MEGTKHAAKCQWLACFSNKGAAKNYDALRDAACGAGACGKPGSAANLYVRATGTPPESEGGSGNSASASPQLAGSPSASQSCASLAAEDCAWHECAEDWEQQGTQAAGSDLPAELSAIISNYKQGQPMGCKPTLALMLYMERSGTNLDQLHELLAPQLAAEEPDADLPTPPCQAASPLDRTLSLMRQASATGSPGSSPQPQDTEPAAAVATGSRQPSIARLLGNVALLQRTMQVMDSQDGFRQVAWGPLELWYKHDMVAKSQVIKARCILEEPVENLVCLAREVDLVTSWNPAITQMSELGSYSPAEMLVYLLLWVPWPLVAPEVVNYAVGVDMLDTSEGCVMIATNGHLSHLPPGVQLPQQARAMRLTMDAGGFKFRPLPALPERPGVARTEAVVLVGIDASKWAVPDAIIGFVLKVFAPLVYKSVLKVLRRMFHSPASASAAAMPQRSASSSCSVSGEGDTALLARLAARPEYAAIAAHVRRHLAAQQQQQQQQQ